MEERAQGAIEYLLIIGAAILVVAVVVIALTGVLGGAKDTSDTATGATTGANNDLLCQADCTSLGANTGAGTSCEELYPTTCPAAP